MSDDSPTRPAESHWHLVFVKKDDEVWVVFVGPWTTAGVAQYAEGAEILWIKFKLGAFMPHLPAGRFLDTETVLPGASSRSFWLKGSVWEFPDHENAETFVDRLVRNADGGAAEVAVLDALDEQAVDEHAQDVVSQAGSIDVSFNLITRGDVQGIPLIDMTTDDLLRAVVNGLRSNFVTARAAARRMVEQGSGVILALDSGSANGSPMMGSTGPADAATDIFVRNLAAVIAALIFMFLPAANTYFRAAQSGTRWTLG